MKIGELKHNHSLTDLLKILLFTIIMLAPIGMVATRCLYVIANKNAYQSYSGKENEYTQTKITNVNQFQLGSEYLFDSTPNNLPQTNFNDSGMIKFNNLHNLNSTSSAVINADLTNANYFRYYVYSSGTKTINFYDDTQTQLYNFNINNNNTNFEFALLSFASQSNINNFLDNFSILDIQNNSYIDNVFEYSVSQLEESTLFNWTENTAIYSGINAMNSQLGINSPAITIVLTYWLILTCIYIIIDIVLKLFTYLTHMIGSRKS